MEWKEIQVNKQNIKTYTNMSVLIAMPHNSEYDGFTFWHPAKLIKNGKQSNSISISYNDGFVFKLKKYGNGKYNKFDVIDEHQVNVEEFENAFAIMNNNIVASKKDAESYLFVKEPKKIDKEIEILEELKNDKH